MSSFFVDCLVFLADHLVLIVVKIELCELFCKLACFFFACLQLELCFAHHVLVGHSESEKKSIWNLMQKKKKTKKKNTLTCRSYWQLCGGGVLGRLA